MGWKKCVTLFCISKAFGLSIDFGLNAKTIRVATALNTTEEGQNLSQPLWASLNFMEKEGLKKANKEDRIQLVTFSYAGKWNAAAFQSWAHTQEPIDVAILPLTSSESKALFEKIRTQKQKNIPQFILPYANRFDLMGYRIPRNVKFLNTPLDKLMGAAAHRIQPLLSCKSADYQFILPKDLSAMEKETQEQLALSKPITLPRENGVACGNLYKETAASPSQLGRSGIADLNKNKCLFIFGESAALPACLEQAKNIYDRVFVFHSEPTDFFPDKNLTAAKSSKDIFLVSNAMARSEGAYQDWNQYYEDFYKTFSEATFPVMARITKLEILGIESAILATAPQATKLKTPFGNLKWTAMSPFPVRDVSLYRISKSGDAIYIADLGGSNQ